MLDKLLNFKIKNLILLYIGEQGNTSNYVTIYFAATNQSKIVYACSHFPMSFADELVTKCSKSTNFHYFEKVETLLTTGDSVACFGTTLISKPQITPTETVSIYYVFKIQDPQWIYYNHSTSELKFKKISKAMKYEYYCANFNWITNHKQHLSWMQSNEWKIDLQTIANSAVCEQNIESIMKIVS